MKQPMTVGRIVQLNNDEPPSLRVETVIKRWREMQAVPETKDKEAYELEIYELKRQLIFACRELNKFLNEGNYPDIWKIQADLERVGISPEAAFPPKQVDI